ncbi:hypothetical protein SAMN05444287_1073 [Octadecabacter temperatus]|uniref:Uncharacterized protein n=1 Tax=Octadecabacter temperatus TaxID=1458307 RepID=A0A0K0Y4P4_9RHOB|nr:hypothetical protein [Octadecabacter temperatus]AKS45968.1 hypothetical protein OSB_14160 [Octadecabacter temperatus]SIO04630.1 hypothetical protein SAMN05444287_1073 [Octadecabacter temperatus]
MRAFLFGALATLPIGVAADVSEVAQQQIIDEAQEFSAALLSGDGIEHSISRTFEPYAETAARQLNLPSTQDLYDAMRLGYAQSKELVEVVEHNVQADGAVFGENGPLKWGIVPFTSQIKYLETAEILPRECNSYLVFGFGGEWFVQTRDAFSDQILQATMPGFTFLNEPSPPCSAPAS